MIIENLQQTDEKMQISTTKLLNLIIVEMPVDILGDIIYELMRRLQLAGEEF